METAALAHAHEDVGMPPPKRGRPLDEVGQALVKRSKEPTPEGGGQLAALGCGLALRSVMFLSSRLACLTTNSSTFLVDGSDRSPNCLMSDSKSAAASSCRAAPALFAIAARA